MAKCQRGTVDSRRGTATPLWLLKSQTSRFYRHQISCMNSWKMIAYILLFLSLVSIILYSRGKLPIPEQWLFLLKGRRMLIDRTEKVSHYFTDTIPRNSRSPAQGQTVLHADPRKSSPHRIQQRALGWAQQNKRGPLIKPCLVEAAFPTKAYVWLRVAWSTRWRWYAGCARHPNDDGAVSRTNAKVFAYHGGRGEWSVGERSARGW